MSSAGYNGWADAPEDEREGAEPYERDAETEGEMPVRAELPMLPPATTEQRDRRSTRRRGDRAA